MRHKRRRAKNRRAGCLFCKPFKANHATLTDRDRRSDRRRMDAADARDDR